VSSIELTRNNISVAVIDSRFLDYPLSTSTFSAAWLSVGRWTNIGAGKGGFRKWVGFVWFCGIDFYAFEP
jgi:hypothetical protein